MFDARARMTNAQHHGVTCMSDADVRSIRPTRLERGLNRVLGFLAARGLAPGYCHLLSVRGRKTGKVYSNPVNLLSIDGRWWLVAPRGPVAWTKNAEAAGEVELQRRKRVRYTLRTTQLSERPAVLKRYLETWPGQVQRFFSVPAGAPLEAFERIAVRYPVYELTVKE
jgi:deazaflavin-dependent oxidoreductase (nitroreductase family)